MQQGEKHLKLVCYPEWLGWITTLAKFSKINFFSPSQVLENLKTCLSVLPLNKETQSYLSEPSSQIELSRCCREQIFKKSTSFSRSFNGAVTQQLWNNCEKVQISLVLESEKLHFFLSPTCLTLDESLPHFRSRIFSPIRIAPPLSASESMRISLDGVHMPGKYETLLLLHWWGKKEGYPASPNGAGGRKIKGAVQGGTWILEWGTPGIIPQVCSWQLSLRSLDPDFLS